MAPVEWTEQNRRELVDFFNRETGQKVKEWVEQYAPRIEGKTIEEKAMSATAYGEYIRLRNLVKTLTTHSNNPDPKDALMARTTRFVDTGSLDVKK